MVKSPSVNKNGLTTGAWTEEEDNKLRSYVLRYGHWNWRELPKFAGLARCGKSCRLRWVNYLKPGLKRGSISREEEEMIIKLQEELGNKWSVIAAKLPGRTDNEIKNYWNSALKKRKKQDPKSKIKNDRRSQIMHVKDQKEQDSSMCLLESTNQKPETSAGTAAADATADELSFSTYNHSTLLGGTAENSFTSEESFTKFFGSVWTEPFSPITSDSRISLRTSDSSSILDLEDLVRENGINLEEEPFVESFKSFPTEPAFSNTSDGLISPSTSCNSIVTTSDEASADAFRDFWTGPLSLEEEFPFTSSLDYDDVDLFNQFGELIQS